MADGKISALDKVLSMLSPRGFVILAITLIFSLVVLSLFGIHQGREVKIFGLEISSKSPLGNSSGAEETGDTKVHEFIKTLPIEVQATTEESRKKIAIAVSEFKKATTNIVALETKIDALEEELEKMKNELGQEREEKAKLQDILQENEDNFLNKILRLDAERKRLDGSINLKFKVKEKEKIFLLVQEILWRIGHYDGPIDADPLRAQEALKQYKVEKGLTNERYLFHVTLQTVVSLMLDFAETLLKESNG